jgi:hypothetical protein
MPRRALKECLAEELRCLDSDEVFGETVRSIGTPGVHQESRVALTGKAEPGSNRDRFSLIGV